MTNFEYMRERLEHRAGIFPPCSRREYSDLVRSQWSPHFERLMRNRLIMGCLRYGGLVPFRSGTDRVAGMKKRLEQYRQTGNKECLVDIANVALIEFEQPNHPMAHWEDIQGDHTFNAKLMDAALEPPHSTGVTD